MTTHELKTWPVYFQRVWEGEKTFEVRLDDRGYQKGDTVVLREWDRAAACECPGRSDGKHAAACAKYSGRTITARIGFVMASTPGRGNTRGFVGMGYVVFSLCGPKNVDGRTVIGGSVAQGSPINVIVTAPPPVNPAAVARQVAEAAARQAVRR